MVQENSFHKQGENFVDQTGGEMVVGASMLVDGLEEVCGVIRGDMGLYNSKGSMQQPPGR